MNNDRNIMGKTSRYPSVVFPVFLFTISFFYLFFFAKGLFFQQENNSLFIFSGDYISRFLVKPGGLLEYAGSFLAQGYFSDLYGAVVLSLLLLLFWSITLKTVRALSDNNSPVLLLILVPTCMLLLMQTRYEHFLHHTLGYILLAAFFNLSIKCEEKRLSFVIPALFPLFYFIAGSFALIFPFVFLFYSLIYKKDIPGFLRLAILFAIAILSLILSEKVLFFQPALKLITYPILESVANDLHISNVILICYLILLPVLIRISSGEETRMKAAGTVITFLITVFILILHYDHEKEYYLKFEKLFFSRNYDKIIELHEVVPSETMIGQYYYNLALSEEDQLCERMFSGRQDFGKNSLLLPKNQDYTARLMHFYYTAGFINEAHHLAFESMVFHGYQPEIMKVLIRTDLINGNFKTAERNIDLLKKTFHYRDWAKKYGKLLYDRDAARMDPELWEKTLLLPRRDFFISRYDNFNIDMMLISNPDNRTALEYRLAWLLLEKDYRGVVYQVKKMKDMPYKHIPRHIEEAIILFSSMDSELPYLGEFEVRQDTKTKFEQYMKETAVFKEGNQKDFENLNLLLQKTFWYYFDFR